MGPNPSRCSWPVDRQAGCPCGPCPLSPTMSCSCDLTTPFKGFCSSNQAFIRVLFHSCIFLYSLSIALSLSVSLRAMYAGVCVCVFLLSVSLCVMWAGECVSIGGPFGELLARLLVVPVKTLLVSQGLFSYHLRSAATIALISIDFPQTRPEKRPKNASLPDIATHLSALLHTRFSTFSLSLSISGFYSISLFSTVISSQIQIQSV